MSGNNGKRNCGDSNRLSRLVVGSSEQKRVRKGGGTVVERRKKRKERKKKSGIKAKTLDDFCRKMQRWSVGAETG